MNTEKNKIEVGITDELHNAIYHAINELGNQEAEGVWVKLFEFESNQDLKDSERTKKLYYSISFRDDGQLDPTSKLDEINVVWIKKILDLYRCMMKETTLPSELGDVIFDLILFMKGLIIYYINKDFRKGNANHIETIPKAIEEKFLSGDACSEDELTKKDGDD